MMLTRPCYNELTKTDCPDRCAGCAAHCERWAAYVASRNKDYKRRLGVAIAKSDYNGHRVDRMVRIRKAQERLMSRFGRRHSG